MMECNHYDGDGCELDLGISCDGRDTTCKLYDMESEKIYNSLNDFITDGFGEENAWGGFIYGAEWALKEIQKQNCGNCINYLTPSEYRNYCRLRYCYHIEANDKLRCNDWQKKG